MSEYVWRCPYCNRDQTVNEEGRQVGFTDLTLQNADGNRRFIVKFVVCPDPACRKFSLSASLHTLEQTGNRSYTGKHLNTWFLVPPSRARTFPVELPAEVLADYREACLVEDFSPRVSSALARRCLSRMIRDFWQVQPGSLGDEFRQIKGTVDPLAWEAIESVRRTGMIGARMDSEQIQIDDGEPGEEKLLISLVETLIQDWYVTRQERRKRLESIKEIAADSSSLSTPGNASEPLDTV